MISKPVLIIKQAYIKKMNLKAVCVGSYEEKKLIASCLVEKNNGPLKADVEKVSLVFYLDSSEDSSIKKFKWVKR